MDVVIFRVNRSSLEEELYKKYPDFKGKICVFLYLIILYSLTTQIEVLGRSDGLFVDIQPFLI